MSGAPAQHALSDAPSQRKRKNNGSRGVVRCRRQEEPGARALCQAQHVERSNEGRFSCFDGIVLVMHRGCGAGQVVYLVDLQLDGIRDVMPNELKILPALQCAMAVTCCGKRAAPHTEAPVGHSHSADSDAP